jgi:acyl dehydratase
MSRDRYLEDYTDGEEIRAPGVTLTEADVIEFAFRYDPQPFHIDKMAAEQSIYGGLIASGWQVAILAFRMLVQVGLVGRGSLGSPGLDAVRWHLPARPGDTLYPVATVSQVRASKTKPDRGVVTLAYRVDNQAGETVMSWQGVQLVAKRPE